MQSLRQCASRQAMLVGKQNARLAPHRSPIVLARVPSAKAGEAKAAPADAVALNELMEVAILAAEKGAEVVREALDRPRSISFKGATDLVTETDKASEDAVLAVLRKHYPRHALLGEEGGVSGDTDSSYLWCVDPLDGTTNFAHSYPAFAVSVGVVRGVTPVAGCVVEFTGGPHAWATRTFAAHTGRPTTCNGKPVRVSQVSDVRRSLLVTGFGYEHDEAWAANMELFKEFTDVCQGVRRLGAAAVDLCHLSMGVVDGYWEYRLKPWDMAAGIVIAQEAGATITTMDGRPFSVFERSMLASNTLLHQQIMDKTDPKTRGLLAANVDLSPWFVPPGYDTSRR
uniref:Inositol-1-monophosphatase n=2 Tax=Chlamydomonas reinhardtii TaxID=3055 RepID=A8I3J5_CHLRE|nr:inositol monophosphatase [Chlamydomonas reinhardtii]|eukprot:XP_001699711.1 inositol monophosphatase [Chlamydomonas reinhardtii]